MCLFMAFIISPLTVFYCIPAGTDILYTCARSDACTSAGAINRAHRHGNCVETLREITTGDAPQGANEEESEKETADLR